MGVQLCGQRQPQTEVISFPGLFVLYGKPATGSSMRLQCMAMQWQLAKHHVLFARWHRLVCSLMMHGRNNGKKLMAVSRTTSLRELVCSSSFPYSAMISTPSWLPTQVRIVKHAFEIIHLLTDQNPIQVLVDAIINRCALGQQPVGKPIFATG